MSQDEGRYDFEQTLVSHGIQIIILVLFIDVWKIFGTRSVRERIYSDATAKKSFGKKQKGRRTYWRRWKKKQKLKETYVHMQ